MDEKVIARAGEIIKSKSAAENMGAVSMMRFTTKRYNLWMCGIEVEVTGRF